MTDLGVNLIWEFKRENPEYINEDPYVIAKYLYDRTPELKEYGVTLEQFIKDSGAEEDRIARMPERGAVSEIAHAIPRGIANALPLVQKEANVYLPEGWGPSQQTITTTEQAIERNRFLQPGRLTETSPVVKTMAGGLESAAHSMTAMAPGYAIGTLTSAIPGVGQVAAPIIGAAVSGGGAFGAAEYYDFTKEMHDLLFDNMVQKNISDGMDEATAVNKADQDFNDLVKPEALKSAMVEAGGEALADALDVAIFKGGASSLAAPAKKALKDKLISGIVSYLKTTGKMMPGEIVTEVGQTYGEQKLREPFYQKAGKAIPDMGSALEDTALQTAASVALGFGPVAATAKGISGRRNLNNLRDMGYSDADISNITPEQMDKIFTDNILPNRPTRRPETTGQDQQPVVTPQINEGIANAPDLQAVVPPPETVAPETGEVEPAPPIDAYMDILSRPPQTDDEFGAIQGGEAIDKDAEAAREAEMQMAAESGQKPGLSKSALEVIASSRKALKRRKAIEMKKPKEERDWTAINDIDDLIKEAAVTGSPELLTALKNEFGGKLVEPTEVTAAKFNQKAKEEEKVRKTENRVLKNEEGLFVSSKGTPFKSEKAAVLLNRANNLDGEVIPVPGGWAIMPREKAIEEDQKARGGGAAPVVEPQQTKPFILPAYLSKIKPRYGYKKNNFTLSFSNDFDRAAYTLAQKTKNKAHDRILAAMQEQTGMSGEELVAHGKRVRDGIKAIAAQRTESGNIQVPAVGAGLVSKDEVDLAAHEAATSPNNIIPQPTEAMKKAGDTEGKQANPEFIGRNKKGQMLFQDSNGVRYRVEDNIKISEPVTMRPTKKGVSLETSREAGSEWQTVDELKPEKKTPPLEKFKPEVEPQPGDMIKFTPYDKKFNVPIEGIVRESINNGAGYHVIIGDSGRVDRIWKNKGDIEILKPVKPTPKTSVDKDIEGLLAYSDKVAKKLAAKEKQEAAQAKIKSGLEKIKAGTKAFNALFGEEGAIGDMGEADPEKWQKVKEALDLMWEGFRESSEGIKEAAKAFIEHAMEALTTKGKPYIDKYIKEDIKKYLEKEQKSGKIETKQQKAGVNDEKGLLPKGRQGNEGVSPSGNTQGGILTQSIRPGIVESGKGDNSGADTNVLAPEQASGERLPGPELPAGPEPMEGQQASEKSGKGLPGDRGNGLVSDAVGGTNDPKRTSVDDINYELENAEPISLTKGQRREINAQVKELLKRGGPFSQYEKNILRQYTGEGGLGTGKKESLNQHYTDYPTIKAIYRAIKSAAFKFKKALEPSVGSGNFVGMAPDANWTTVDIDPTNHAIVKALYPKARHYLTSFENIKKKGFDLVISNVPFLEKRGADALRNRPDIKALHDFYFVHALDRVRNNGLVVFITSRGTMDKKNDSVRREIVDKADILAAFRLPAGHFEKNTDTSVIADVIVMQKRPEGAKPSSEQQAINKQFITASETEDGIVLNEYYHDRMDHMLGDVEVGKDKARFGKITYNITGPAALERLSFTYKPYEITESDNIHVQEKSDIPRDTEKFYKWASDNNIPYKLSKITTTHTGMNGETIETVIPPTDGFERGIVIENDSRVLIIDETIDFSDVDGQARIYKTPDLETARKILTLQRIADKIADFQLNDDADSQDQAIAMIEDYQKRYKKHPAKDRKLKKIMTDAGEKVYYAELSTLFKKDFGMPDSLRTKTRYTGSGVAEVTSDSPLNVRAFSLEDNKGRIQLKGQTLISSDEIPKLLNRGYAVAGRDVLQNDILYYSGNIYQKIAEAEALKKKTRAPGFKDSLTRQIEHLEAIRPAPKTIDDILFKGHEQWCLDILREAGIQIERFNREDGKVGVYYPDSKIYERYLNNKQLVSRKKDESVTSFMNRIREAEDIVAAENHRIKNRIKENPEILEELETAYNSKFRNYVKPEYDKAEYLIADVLAEIEKNSDIRLRKNQIKWVIQAAYEGKGINAHDVGGGKTFASITLARVFKKRGVAKKPIFVVPAKTIKKWERDIKTLFPDATVVNLGKLAANKRTRELFKLSHTNADYVLISHEGFAHLQLPLEKEMQYVDAILSEHIDDPAATGRAAAKIDNDIERLKRVTREATRDTRLTFDKLGIDMIVADEAHNFKNIAVRGELVRFGLGTAFGINIGNSSKYRIKGNGDKWNIYNPKTGEKVNRKTYKTRNEASEAIKDLPALPESVTLKSARSYDFRFKANYITDTNNGNNVFLLTATPTPNKPMEIYTMLRHLSPSIFHEYGIFTDKDFANQFFDLGTSENRVKNTAVNVMRAIINGQDLRGILNRYVDKVRMEDMPWIKVPIEKPHRHFIEQSTEYALIADDLRRREEEAPSRPERGDDRLLTIYTSGRAASIDPRLYGGTHANVNVDERSYDASDDKVQFTIESVMKQYNADNNAGQIIFLDAAGHQQVARGALAEDIHTEMKKTLVSQGLKPKQVAIINGKVITNPATGVETASGDKDQRKQDIADAYNAGDIKVIIGTTASMGEGMDLQVPTSDIWHVDIPFKPGVFRQRNGRGVRYGNKYKTGIVNIHYMMMRGSFDAMSFDLVLKKKGWNEALWDREVADVISTEEEMTTGVMPQRQQILIELETDPVRKAELIIGFREDQLIEERRQAASADYYARNKVFMAEHMLEENQEVLRKRNERLETITPDMNIENEKERNKDFNKKKGILKRSILFTKKRIVENKERIKALEEKQKSTQAELDKITARLKEFTERFTDDEGNVAIPKDFDVNNPRFFPDDPVNMTASDDDIKFQTKQDITNFSGVSLSDIRNLKFLKNKSITINKDGHIEIVLAPGRTLKITGVKGVGNGKVKVHLGIDEKGSARTAKFHDGVVEFTLLSDIGTIYHEIAGHAYEEMGIINQHHVTAINKAIEDETGAKVPRGIAGKEARADWISENLLSRDKYRGTAVGRALQKIADFVDALINIVKTTSRGVLRGIESGKTESKTAKAVYEFAQAPMMEMKSGAPRWYSAVKNAVKAMNFKAMPGRDLIVRLKKTPGVKQAELDWLGLEDWASGKKKVTKQELLDFIAANGVQIKEVVKGEELTHERLGWTKRGNFYRPSSEFENVGKIEYLPSNGKYVYESGTRNVYDTLQDAKDALLRIVWHSNILKTKYAKYQEPGGKNYREILMMLPVRTDYGKYNVEKLPNGEISVKNEDGDEIFRDSESFFNVSALRESIISKEDAFRSSHFGMPNVVAHARINERTISDVNEIDRMFKKGMFDKTTYNVLKNALAEKGHVKILFGEEYQSDWAQKGRKKGFKEKFNKQGQLNKVSFELAKRLKAEDYWGFDNGFSGVFNAIIRHSDFAKKWEMTKQTEKLANKYRELSKEKELAESGIPDMPYKQTSQWTELLFKRMVRYAAENGFDALAWTPGEIQADRYDLSKYIDKIDVTRGSSKKNWQYKLDLHAKDGENFTEYTSTKEEMEDLVGKELSDKIIKDNITIHNTKTYSGLDLKVGGEGMIAFYDRILPAVANKFFGKKKWGKARVGTIEIGYKGKSYLYSGETELAGPFDTREEAETANEELYGGSAEISTRRDDQEGTKGLKVWLLPITPEMRSKALGEGMPLFQVKPLTGILKQDIPADDPNLARFKRKTEKRMTKGQRVITPAQWNAKRYPKFDRIFKRQRKREKEATTMLSMALEKTNEVWDLTPDQEAEISTVISSLENKKITSIPNWYVDEGKEELKLNPDHYAQLKPWLTSKGVSEPVADAYVKMRESLDSDLLTVWEKMNANEDVQPATIKTFRKQLNHVHNYFPHIRYGNHYIQFFDDNDIDPETGKPRLVYREHFNSLSRVAAAVGKRQYERILKETPELKNYRMDWGKVDKLSEEVYANPIQMDAIQQVLNAAVSKIADKDTQEMFKSLLPNATADELKQRGWAAHAIHRKNIPGHEMEDIKKVLFDYKSGLYGWLTKMDASKDFTTLLGDIDARKDRTLYGYSKNYVYDMLANSTDTDRAVQMAKSVFFLKYLGGNLKTAALNLTQNLIAGAPRLGMEVKGGYIKWMNEAAKTLTKMELTDKQRRFVQEMHEDGTSEANFIKDVSGRMSAGPKKLGGKIVEIMGMPMAVAEKFNRVTLGLAAFNAASRGEITNKKTLEKLGLKPGEKAGYETAKAFAEDIVDDAHFVYGKSNRPEMFRGSDAAKIASTAYVFRSFSHHLFNLWKMMWREGGPGKRALLKSMAATVAIGGMASIPFYKTMMNAIRQASGDDWGDNLLDQLPADANWLRDVAMYGLPSIAGVNLGGSVGMEIPVFERFNTRKSLTGQVWSGFGEFIGIPGAVAEDIEKSIHMINSGRPARALEFILPSVAANVLKGYRMRTEGLTTASGRPIVLPGATQPTMLDRGEMLKKMLGFQPIKSQKGWDLSKKIQNYQAYKLNAQASFADKMIDAVRKKDKKEIKKIQDEISKWNIKQMKAGHPEYVVDISRSVRARLIGRQPPAYLRGRALEMKRKMFGEAE